MKKIIKRIIPTEIQSIWRSIKFRKYAVEYKKSLKELNKKGKRKSTPKIVFIISFPETWNSLKTVYESCIKTGLETIILCVPKMRANCLKEYEIDENGINEAYDHLKNNENAIKANLDNGEWFDLKEYNPDYVFFSKPYKNHYPKEYQFNKVCKYSKICYVPYGYDITPLYSQDSSIVEYNQEFLLKTYSTFTTNKSTLISLKKFYAIQNILRRNKYIYIGFPRFDILLNDKSNNEYNKNNITILWMPRWEFGKDVRIHSNFLNYYREFINFAKENKNITFILRPHPLMFESIIEKEILTKSEIEEIKNEIQSMDNFTIDVEKDYISALKKANILIADYTTLIAEFFVTGKPIIYCHDSKMLNKEGKVMYSTFYHAISWKEIKQNIELLISGKDLNKEKRQNAVKEILKYEDGKSGEKIVNYILRDYYKN